MTRTIVLFWAASAAIFGFIFGNEADEIYVTDLAILLAALAAILMAQGALLYGVGVASRRMNREPQGSIAVKVLAILMLMSNAYFTTFINFDSSAQMQVLMAVAAGALFIPPMFIERWRGFALFMSVAYFVLSLGMYSYTRITMADPPAYKSDKNIKITARRNVYLIGNESLNSPKALRELYGAQDLPHVDYLTSNGFRVLDSAYSADLATLRSYARVFEFGRPLTQATMARRAVFNSSNSTFSMLHDSGYKIAFIYKVTYFGLNPSLVDYAFPERGFYQCEFVPRSFFYVLCRKRVKTAINRVLFNAQPLNPETFRQRVIAARNSKEPWFTFFHQTYPFHTQMTHSYKDAKAVEAFKAELKGALPKVRKNNFEGTIGTILKEDPGAVIVTIGDHGASLTRGAALDVPNPIFTPAQVLEDRYGVLLAVYPADFCRGRIFEGSTTSYIIEQVALCLNGDDSPTPEDIKRSRTFHIDFEPRTVDQYLPPAP